jgi:hypothetical protein
MLTFNGLQGIISPEESESELLYDWRFTANQFVLATSPLRLTTSNFIFQLNTCGYSSYVTSSLTRREDGSVVYNSCCHYQVRVPRVSDSRLTQPGESGPRIYIPQKQDGLVMPPGSGFPFCRLLRLGGLRWGYSTVLFNVIIGASTPVHKTLHCNFRKYF